MHTCANPCKTSRRRKTCTHAEKHTNRCTPSYLKSRQLQVAQQWQRQKNPENMKTGFSVPVMWYPDELSRSSEAFVWSVSQSRSHSSKFHSSTERLSPKVKCRSYINITTLWLLLQCGNLMRLRPQWCIKCFTAGLSLWCCSSFHVPFHCCNTEA